MIKFICNFNNLLYLSFQLKKYLWNYFSTGSGSIFRYQVKVSRQKAYLKGKHGLFCNNFLSHLYVCTASSCQLRLQKSVICSFKARNPRLIPQATTIYFVFLVWKKTLIEEDSLILKDFYLIIYFRTALFEGWKKA